MLIPFKIHHNTFIPSIMVTLSTLNVSQSRGYSQFHLSSISAVLDTIGHLLCLEIFTHSVSRTSHPFDFPSFTKTTPSKAPLSTPLQQTRSPVLNLSLEYLTQAHGFQWHPLLLSPKIFSNLTSIHTLSQ